MQILTSFLFPEWNCLAISDLTECACLSGVVPSAQLRSKSRMALAVNACGSTAA